MEDLKRDNKKWNMSEEAIKWLKKIIDNYNR
jgi:cob(I)alamin adenosyltransferase